MAKYVDGFVIPVPKKNIAAYHKMAAAAAKIWMEYGALQYFETVGDDINANFGMPFTKLAKTAKNETVVFSWIIYKNKAHRDKVNKLIMKDPRIENMMKNKKMPFDGNKMSYGGFKVLVEK